MLQIINKLLGIDNQGITPELLRNASIIDVRSSQEFQQGHAAGTINIPLQNLDQNMEKLRQLPQPIVTCCVSGNRSGMAARQLRTKGLEALNGGSWQRVDHLLNAQ